MRPQNEDGTLWSLETSNLVAASIREQALTDLHQHEEEMSQGRMNAANKWAPTMEMDSPHGTGKINTPDPVLATMRHSGDDQLNLFRSRWARFCSVPQDEKVYRDKLDIERRAEQIEAMVRDGESIEQALKSPMLPMSPMDEIEDEEPPKRGPGRPAGSKNKARVSEPV